MKGNFVCVSVSAWTSFFWRMDTRASLMLLMIKKKTHIQLRHTERLLCAQDKKKTSYIRTLRARYAAEFGLISLINSTQAPHIFQQQPTQNELTFNGI